MGPKKSMYCKFNGCNNHNLMKGIHFYRFPKDEKRCKAWVKIAQNKKLFDLTASQLYKSYFLCSHHFQDWCFMNTTSKTSLVHNAIPASPKPVPPPKVSSFLYQMKEEKDKGKEEEDEGKESEGSISIARPAVNTRTISKDHFPRVDSPVKKQRVTIYPIISKVSSTSNESQNEEDEELELYLKLLTKKLKRYTGFERHQIMHEIDGVFLRNPPSSGCS